MLDGSLGPALFAAVGGYLLGSVPFGLLLTRLAGLGDIRSIGSGNIGATNVLRTGNKALAAATLLLDGSKGALAAILAAHWSGAAEANLIAGFAAVLGHNFPVWLKFKGGKGVATSLGVLLVTAWPVGVTACLTWLGIAALFRISSLAALVALASAPFVALVAATPAHALMALGLAVLGFVRHQANIRRLLAGEEPRIGRKNDKPEHHPTTP
jgi:acyl phosphate:glycerol-3-phosphate acyltransferase